MTDPNNVLERLKTADRWMRDLPFTEADLATVSTVSAYKNRPADIFSWANKRDPSVYAAAGDEIKRQRAEIETLKRTVTDDAARIKELEGSITNLVRADGKLLAELSDQATRERDLLEALEEIANDASPRRGLERNYIQIRNKARTAIAKET